LSYLRSEYKAFVLKEAYSLQKKTLAHSRSSASGRRVCILWGVCNPARARLQDECVSYRAFV